MFRNGSPGVDIAYLPNEVKAAVRLLQEHPAKWLPIIARDRCTGCGLCLDCCGPNCLADVAGIAVLARPEMCGGAGDCMAVCATEAIEMAWVISAGERLVGRWRTQAGIEGPALRCRRLGRHP